MFVRQAYLMRHSLPGFCQTLLKLCFLVNQNLIIISCTKHKFLQLVLNTVSYTHLNPCRTRNERDHKGSDESLSGIADASGGHDCRNGAGPA